LNSFVVLYIDHLPLNLSYQHIDSLNTYLHWTVFFFLKPCSMWIFDYIQQCQGVTTYLPETDCQKLIQLDTISVMMKYKIHFIKVSSKRYDLECWWNREKNREKINQYYDTCKKEEFINDHKSILRSKEN